MLKGLGEVRRALVVGAATLVVVAACDTNPTNSAQGELGRVAEVPQGGSGDAESSSQAGAPVAPTAPPTAPGAPVAPTAPPAGPEVGGGGASGGADSEPERAEAGAGGEPAQSCDGIAHVVPTTCPMGDASDVYRETGLGFLEVIGSGLHAVSDARGINAAGDVVGYASLCDGVRAFLYRDGKLLDLDPIPGARYSFATDVNDEGDVLGEVDGGAVFVWKNGVTTLLNDIGPGRGIAINNLGQVLGADGEGAFIWDAGLVTRLQLDRNARVTNLNDRGQVTGYYEYGAQAAFVWEDGVLTPLPPLPGDTMSFASAINEAGQVVGSSSGKSNGGRAVLWSSGVPVDITPAIDTPLLYATGIDINEHGVVLGHFEEEGRPNGAAFLFDHGLTTRVLPEDPTVGAALTPSALNDAGQFAGTTVFWTGSPNQATVWSRSCFGACCN